MKRYLLFAGSTYYPSGGIDDLQGDFDTIEEASTHAKTESEKEGVWGWDWWHIVDNVDMKKVGEKPY